MAENCTWRIRPAAPDDSAVFAEIYRRSWQAAYAGLLPEEAIRSINAGRMESCRKQLAPDSGVWNFLALADGTPAGLLSLCRYRSAGHSDWGEIRAIYLLAEYWSKGGGRQLLDFAVAELRRRGFDTMALWVLKNNLRARRFYEANGFYPDGAIREELIGTVQNELRYRRRV